MSLKLSIQTASGSFSFVNPPFYGLEAVNVTGLVCINQIAPYPSTSFIRLGPLIIILEGKILVSFPSRSGQKEHRSRIFLRHVKSLPSPTRIHSRHPFIQIPFCFTIPSPQKSIEEEEISLCGPRSYSPDSDSSGEGAGDISRQCTFESRDLVPAPHHHLLPPSITLDCRGISISVTYTLKAKLIQPGLFDWSLFERSIEAEIDVPMKVYDPAFVTYLLLREEKVWKSPPSHEPVEYQVCLESTIMGPGDLIKLSYAFCPAAGVNARLKGLHVAIKQHLWVGEACGFAEFPAHLLSLRNLFPGARYRSKRTDIIVSHDISFQPDWKLTGSGKEITQAGHIMLGIPQIHADGSKDGEERGNSSILVPTTNTSPEYWTASLPLHPPTDLSSLAHYESRHTFELILSLWNAQEDIILRTGIIITNVGSAECQAVLDSRPYIVPPVEYGRVSGGEAWIPEYVL